MRPVAHDRRIVLLALGAAIPGVVTALAILWTGDYSSKVRWTLTALIVIAWLAFTQALRERVVRPLQTVSNLLAAMREEDFSIRARGARGDDPLGEVLIEVNALAETLREQRLGALEATALLSPGHGRDRRRGLRVRRRGRPAARQPVRRAAARSTRAAAARAARRGAGAGRLFSRRARRRSSRRDFPGGAGRWEIRRSVFRQGGAPHRLLVLADVSRPLREEERQAWQRLIRVLGHELNNSLAPIQSIAGSLQKLSSEPEPPADWRADLRQGLSIIESRAEGLSRFTTAYAKLARLPPPRTAPVAVDALVRRAASLETRLPVGVIPGPPIVIQADSDQLDQLLINLVRNATDAALETQGGVALGWKRTGPRLEIWVADDGPGLPNTTNLFVPFFTTKPGGSGIGLVLSRQIAEAHGGTLTLENRKGHRGCIAWLRLPLQGQV